MDWLGSLIRTFQTIPIRYFVVGAIACGVLLFLPDAAIQKIRLESFMQNYASAVGLAFIICAAFVSVSLCEKIVEKIKSRGRNKENEAIQIECLQGLSKDEKRILAFYVVHNTKWNILPSDNVATQRLENCQVIYRSDGVGDVFDGYVYNISDFALKYLRVNFELLAPDNPNEKLSMVTGRKDLLESNKP